jgi:hypothetical protein
MSEIVERLGYWAARVPSATACTIMREAADHIEQLEAELLKATEALTDIRNRILCPAGPSPSLDDVQAIASAALPTSVGEKE